MAPGPFLFGQRPLHSFKFRNLNGLEIIRTPRDFNFRSRDEFCAVQLSVIDLPHSAPRSSGGPRCPNAARALCEESLHD